MGVHLLTNEEIHIKHGKGISFKEEYDNLANIYGKNST